MARLGCRDAGSAVVADEDVAKLWPAAPAFAWIYDITDEHCPVPIATFQVEV